MGSVNKMKKILLITLLLSFIAPYAYAGAVIGQDDVFVIAPMTILTSGTQEAEVFNYFATLEIFGGMVALFIRLFLKILRF